MNGRIQDLFTHTCENYLMPFFWQHGSSEETLREYMGKIYACGIRAVCLESRPHPDFAGEQWWRDVDVIMEEAKKRSMKVWILDDSHFPTGFANGAVRNAPDRLKRWYLREFMLRVDGPLEGNHFRVMENSADKPAGDEKKLQAVVLGKREEKNGKVRYVERKDLTGQVHDGWLDAAIPEGRYCLFIYTMEKGAASMAAEDISFLDKDSVRILIDTVYGPHFQHYAAEFGKTFAGFFSDEPGFYNNAGGNPYALGRIGDAMPLPWTEEVKNRLCHDGKDTDLLVGLFHDCGGLEKDVRFRYMDIVTRMYEYNFSCQIGEWCDRHGVEYIGHVLEDGELNYNLGPGTGHYFRAMQGQHMAGVDAVLNDLRPDIDYDGWEFYHYSLPILAASCAHQSERMKGRTMCELFGAYGWSEGLTLMKWIADDFLVNGINHFVPHAFSEQSFPDPDCPPHFYAHGNNPQYPYMHVLFNYMNRACHLLNGGKAAVDTAIFYPAEGNWTGQYKPFGNIGKICLQHQIPYEVLCMDRLRTAEIRDGMIIAGDAQYRHLFVDSIESLPHEYLEIFSAFSRKGAHILFVGRRPSDYEGREAKADIPLIREEDILPMLEQGRECRTETFLKWLRFYHYRQENVDIFMLFNSSMLYEADTMVSLPLSDKTVCYHCAEDRWSVPKTDVSGRFRLHLAKGETLFFITGTGEEIPEVQTEATDCEEKVLQTEFEVSAAPFDKPDQFVHVMTTRVLEDIFRWKNNFSGRIRYEAAFEGMAHRLDLGECHDAVEVLINGQSAGTRIGYPYIFELDHLTHEGTNTLCIETATTLGNAMQDRFSMGRPFEPCGVLGPVRMA